MTRFSSNILLPFPNSNDFNSRASANSRLFKSFEFGNESRMSDENLVILEFKYLQNKKWEKQAVKSARIKRVIEHTGHFHFI